MRFFEKILLYHSFRLPSIVILHRHPVEDAFNSEIVYPSCLRLKALKTGILCSATPSPARPNKGVPTPPRVWSIMLTSSGLNQTLLRLSQGEHYHQLYWKWRGKKKKRAPTATAFTEKLKTTHRLCVYSYAYHVNYTFPFWKKKEPEGVRFNIRGFFFSW